MLLLHPEGLLMFDALRKLFKRSPPRQSADAPAQTPAPEAPVVATSSSPLVFLDTETTGLNPRIDEVVEIAIVDEAGTVLLNTLVRPARHTLWPEAQAVHGISPEDVANAPSWMALLPRVASLCAGKTVIIYNAQFDTGFFPDRFFASTACAMRRYSDANPIGSWVALEEAAKASGYTPSGLAHRALEDSLACRHVWLHGIPKLEAAYPIGANPVIVAELRKGESPAVQLKVKNGYSELRFVTPGSTCKVWTKKDREEINVYRSGTAGGNGQIATLSKSSNPALAGLLSDGYEVTMTLRERRGDTFLFDCVAQPSIQMRRQAALPSEPVRLSPIDDDINRCFIAFRSGMCEAIGSWDAFEKLEATISECCKTKGGRYFKSKAKGAKFAIIFSPYSISPFEVWTLQQEGYKVTSFDRAVTHFGLGDMWDCATYVKHARQVNPEFPKLAG